MKTQRDLLPCGDSISAANHTAKNVIKSAYEARNREKSVLEKRNEIPAALDPMMNIS
jgi:hypothetical protein